MNVVGLSVFRIKREIGRDQVGFAIVIPERCGIVPARRLHETSERGPRPWRIRRRTDEDTFVGRSEVHVEEACMICECTCPDASWGPVHVIVVESRAQLSDVRDDMPNDLP